MTPAEENRALEELDRAIQQIVKLRPLLMLAFARDDEPARQYETDPVHKSTKKFVANVVSISKLVDTTYNAGELIAHPAENTVERVASLPNCLLCGGLAVPRPRRGLCLPCYDGYRRSAYSDIEEYRRSLSQNSSGALVGYRKAVG